MNDPTEGTPSNATLREFMSLMSESAGPRPDCPSPERLWEAARGGLPPADTGALAEHAAACGACVEGWRLARELARPGLVTVRATSPGVPRAARWGLAAAAVVVVLAGAGLLREQLRQPPAPVIRAGSDVVVQSLLPEDVPLPRAKCLLKWSPAGEGAVYSLYVVTEDLRNIASAQGLNVAEFQVAEKNLAALPEGTRFVWRVSARLPDGRVITSTSFIHRLE